MKTKKIYVRDIAKELNLFGIPYSWKEKSFREFLIFNGWDIVEAKEGGDYCDFEYSDIKGYLDLEVEKI
jgi:hypothetical protein